MHFTIDGVRYPVRIASRALVCNGQPCLGMLDRTRRVIWLSDCLPKHRRKRVSFHELRHTWVDARGLKDDEEDDAESAAEMMSTVLEQYLWQGGDAALEGLTVPDEARGYRHHCTELTAVKAYCGRCGAPVAAGSIACEPMQWDADLSLWSVMRGILCTVCDAVTVWRETSTGEGMPLGQIIPYPPPRVLEPKEAREWVRDHAELCRVRLVG